MGNLLTICTGSSSHPSGEEVNYTIYVKTGDRKGAGTDANVYIRLIDESGSSSQQIKLSMAFRDDFEQGSLDSFDVAALNIEGDIRKIEIWRDRFGIKSDWYVEVIMVEKKKTPRRVFHFPVHRWIHSHEPYILSQFDVCLPQKDEHWPQRKRELVEKRSTYQYVVNYPGLPAQIKSLPKDEMFSSNYKWDIVKRKASYLLNVRLIGITTDCWSSLDDIKKLYKWQLPMPKGCKVDWRSDEWFGIQRICGVNNMLIQICQQIPSNLKVDKSELDTHLEGNSLEDVVLNKRLFFTDHRILQRLSKETGCHICSPVALFYLNNSKNLVPIAIQLEQEPGKDNPIFYPSDHSITWLQAKIWYNNADAQYHQSITHLGTTHILMESISICTHRNLSPSHPIFKLLAPHFLFLLAINSRGLQKLVNPNGWVDGSTSVGRIGMFELMKRGVQEWRMDHDAIIINQLSQRGFFDLNLLPEDYWRTPIALEEILEISSQCNPLPQYYWRNDALLVSEVIKTYVLRIVMRHYESEEDVVNDTELQMWTTELTSSKEKMTSTGGISGCGIHGVPGEGELTSRKQLVQLLTGIIFTCSVSHASSFSQYDEYAFPANYAGKLHGKPPTDKLANVTEDDILKQLPNKQETLDIMVITKLLSEQPTNSLGDFEVQYLYDPQSIHASEEFRENLHKVSVIIKKRNESSKYPYVWLDPDKIPNSISI